MIADPELSTGRYATVTIGAGARAIALDFGRTYLVVEQRVDKAFRIADDFVRNGSGVLCISRLHPDMVRERLPTVNVSNIWLSERPGPQNLAPGELTKLVQKVMDFTKENERSIVLIDGIEYLSLYSDFHKLQMFFEQLNDIMMETGSILLVAMDPRLFDPRSLARLRRFAEVVS
ncbi:MAG: DUF835 domain-containing protein [Methanomassiliicoccales archaeon]|nr:DUF835 domain-containing protein [Methanomassiliicoccales archaeon]